LRILGREESFANIIPWFNDAKTVSVLTYMVCMYLLVLKTKKEAVGSRSSRVLTLEKAPATSSAVRACALPAEAAKKDEATVRGAATAGISHFLSSCCCCCWDEEEEEEEAVLRDRRGAEFLLLIDLLERFRAREVVPGNAAALLVMAATCIALKACAISILSLFHCPPLPSFLPRVAPTHKITQENSKNLTKPKISNLLKIKAPGAPLFLHRPGNQKRKTKIKGEKEKNQQKSQVPTLKNLGNCREQPPSFPREQKCRRTRSFQKEKTRGGLKKISARLE
jgi:hypothetical protein